MAADTQKKLKVTGLKGSNGMWRPVGAGTSSDAKRCGALMLCILFVMGSWITLAFHDNLTGMDDKNRVHEKPDSIAMRDDTITPSSPDDPHSHDLGSPVRSHGTRGGGNGTIDNPYMITNVSELQDMRNDLKKHYALANDIDASETKEWNSGNGFKPIGKDKHNPFKGSLDGRGHTIIGLFVKGPSSADYAGLFSYIHEKGSVANVSLVGANISGGWICGGLVGYNDGSVVNCHFSGTVAGSEAVGGLIGRIGDGSVENCSVSGNVSGSSTKVGGLVGINTGSIANCTISGSVTGASSIGGLVGSNSGGWVMNSYYDLDSVRIQGGFHLTIGGLFNEQYQDWVDNGMTLDIADYDATLVPSDDHYAISDIAGFRDLLGFADNSELKFRLAADIDFSSVQDLYIPYLAAEFDGDHHTISNLVVNLNFASRMGLFGNINRGSVSNVRLLNIEMKGKLYVGGLAGGNYYGSVSNCSAVGTISGSEYLGGLMGRNLGSIENCYAGGSVDGYRFIGGLSGVNFGSIENCYATGTITGKENVGGFVGRKFEGSVKNCFWDNETSGRKKSEGGKGRSTTTMMEMSTFSDAGWDIASISDPDNPDRNYTWNIVDSETYPFLSWEEISQEAKDDDGEGFLPGFEVILLISAIGISLTAQSRRRLSDNGPRI